MLSLIAFSLQAAYVAAHGLNRSHDPNIVVPSSSQPQWFDKPGTGHTQYLIWKGRSANGPENDFETIHPSLFGPLTFSPYGYSPADIRAAYDVPLLQGANAIAIVDAYNYPTALADFNVFSRQFGLPVETSTDPTASTNQVLQVVYADGTQPVADSGWSVEQALDIQWVHAIAPNAKIYLVESADNGFNLFNAISVASGLDTVKEVSMSFGALDGSYEASYESVFQQSGVVFFASTGDASGDILFPSVSDSVVGVGGTTLVVNTGHVLSEKGWSSEGGGMSQYSPLPSYQSFLQSRFTNRVVPDVVAVADPATGVAVYNSGAGGWLVVGGTSLSSPLVAAMTNDMGFFQTSTAAEENHIAQWNNTVHIRDITSGATSSGLRAGLGWDTMSGFGAPLVAPVTIIAPNPGQLTATANGRVSYPFLATDPDHPGRTINSTISPGPTWVTWDGVNLVASPPAGTKTGLYPMTLYSSEAGFPANTMIENLSIKVAPPVLTSAAWVNGGVVGGTTATLKISLSNPAASGGLSVGLSSKSAAVPLSSTATFSEGVSTILVNVTTAVVTKPTAVLVNVTYNGVKLSAPILVLPASS